MAKIALGNPLLYDVIAARALLLLCAFVAYKLGLMKHALSAHDSKFMTQELNLLTSNVASVAASEVSGAPMQAL